TIHRVMRACLSGRTLLPLRRVMLSCLQPGYRLLLQCEPRAREQMRVLSEILSTLLSEPEQQSQAILREHQDCMRLTLTHSIWRHGDGSSASCLAAFHWPERAAYRRLIGGR